MKTTGPYPRVQATNDDTAATSHAGGILLTETAHKSGLTDAMATTMARWHNPLALHRPDKICTDLALTLALGGTCLADIAALRSEPALYGTVASDPTVSRTVTTLAAEPDRALTAIRRARARARQHTWALAQCR